MSDAAVKERSEPRPRREQEKRSPDKPDREEEEDREERQDGRSDNSREEENDKNDDSSDDEKKDKKPKGPPIYKRPLFWFILIPVVIVLATGGVIWWLYARAHETTDDAFIAANSTSISPQVAGHVLKRYVDDNQWVKAGQLMVKIDPRDFQEQLDQALADQGVAEGQIQQAQTQVQVYVAQVAQAKADIASATASHDQAAQDLKRYEEVSSAAVSRQQIDQARANERTTRASLDASFEKERAAESQVAYAQSQVRTSQAQLTRAGAAVAYARTQLSYTDIVAPIDGKVTNRMVEDGQYITIGQTLLTLVPRDVWVIANYKETQLTLMRPGQPVRIHVDAFPGETYSGHVDSIQAGSGSTFSLLPPENATGNYVKVVQRVPVKILFDNLPDKPFSPGMSVEPNVKVR